MRRINGLNLANRLDLITDWLFQERLGTAGPGFASTLKKGIKKNHHGKCIILGMSLKPGGLISRFPRVDFILPAQASCYLWILTPLFHDFLEWLHFSG